MITQEAVMDIVALHRQGHSMRFIAKKLGLHRNTVKKFILRRNIGTLLGYQVVKRNPPTSAILYPRETESLTDGIDIPSFWASNDMGIPSSRTAQ